MSILLQSGNAFCIPENVYIIGTMNTADRSIALLDKALRRRFGFIELMPDTAVLGDSTVEGIPLAPWLDALNRRIRDHVGRDARNLQIGHSYLMDRGRPISEFSKLLRVIRDDIIPLLEEYCYEDYDLLERIIGQGLMDAENQRIRQELLDGSMRAESIQALLAPCPEIATSLQAVASEAGSVSDEDEATNEGDDEGSN
jgi:5-methylcytosine-specific restriction protein B